MIKQLFFASALVVSAGGMAIAQQPPPPLSGGGMNDAAPPPPPPGRMPPPHGHHGPPPPTKGFDLRLGHGLRLHVDCADETMKACVDAVRPLLHSFDRTTMQPPSRTDDSDDSYDEDSDSDGSM